MSDVLGKLYRGRRRGRYRKTQKRKDRRTERKRRKMADVRNNDIFRGIFHRSVYHAALFSGKLSATCDNIGGTDCRCGSMRAYDPVSRISGADFQNERYPAGIYVPRSGT